MVLESHTSSCIKVTLLVPLSDCHVFLLHIFPPRVSPWAVFQQTVHLMETHFLVYSLTNVGGRTFRFFFAGGGSLVFRSCHICVGVDVLLNSRRMACTQKRYLQ